MYVHNIPGLMAALKKIYKPDNWRLFIDPCKTSLKADLLHDGHVIPSAEFRDVVYIEETCEMKQLLSCLYYNKLVKI